LNPSSEVVVREGDTLDLELSVPDGYGFIEFNVARPEQGAVAGVLASLALRYPGDDRMAKWVLPVSFSGASHVVGPLYPASYEAEVVLPFGTAGGPRSIDVTAGTVSREWFVLEE